MFRNYLKTSFRYLRRHKLFSLINLAGLSIGLTVCFFVVSYVRFESSYDGFHEHADRIYRVITDVESPSGAIAYEGSSAPMGPALQAAFPEIQASTRLLLDYFIVKKDINTFSEEKVAYADASLFSVFSFPLLSGDRSTMLEAPFNMVLSETAAKRYFGSSNPVGQTLYLDGGQPAVVTGVMKDMPSNAHFKADILVSLSTLLKIYNPNRGSNWKAFGFYTYLLLPPHTDLQVFNRKLNTFLGQYYKDLPSRYQVSAEPLTDIYLHGKPRGNRSGSAVTGNVSNIYIFSAIAVFVLLIACFNFINLTTAFSLQRAKEISVRKVLGASGKQLRFQFLTDAALIALIAFCVSLILIIMLTPAFNKLAGKEVIQHITGNRSQLLLLLIVSLVTGILSGIYPAFFMAAFRPLNGLKGRFSTGTQGLALRRSLVTVQFTISIVLIAATLIVYTQLHYMQNRDLGFRKTHQLYIDFHFDNRISSRSEAVKQELLRIPGVKEVSLSSCLPGRPTLKRMTETEDANGNMQTAETDIYYIDQDFLPQYGIELLAGHNFYNASDTASLLVNETLIKGLGYKNAAAAIGKRLQQNRQSGTIGGVIRDFHFNSFREEVKPLTLRILPGNFTFITLTLDTEDPSASLQLIDKAWKGIMPGMPLIYAFTDDTYNNLYQAEERFGRLFTIFSALAIFISCLGLLGLSAFSIVQRTREIGIRKVLGASASAIITLLTRDFIKLIAIAFLIAVPVAWYIMSQWLNEFAYRTGISWWLFALAGISAVMVTLLTVGIQAYRAAMANPVKSIGTE
ncbi:ABC transporter permease [Sediminibacterium ginsengisoli]|uniref:Putative ABC transport system permease protein n=1 Tax=Sediminibacterium ginsengisoli TaxID=413434 RepID=A0A1T4R305_9BACT|nr:ABC transporter permease [Sediminibacterium ginsengisoli]SKA10434.1 putative ABC transport system permease protein [Sediminibacterium ginsengisoli]